MSNEANEAELKVVDDFTVNAVHLVTQEGLSVDISNLCLNFRLYESIYSKFVTADITLLDSINLLKHYQITGQEFIRISFQHGGLMDELTDTPTIDKTFRVYKLINVARPKETVQMYQIKLCDPFMFSTKNTRVQKVLRGSWSDMLYKVLSKDLGLQEQKIEHWEESKYNNYQFIVPDWTVNEFIDYVTSTASKGEKSSYKKSFFFYQTLMGGFNFKSLDNMVNGILEKTLGGTGKGEVVTEQMTEFPPLIFKPTSGAGDEPTREHIRKIGRPQRFDTLGATVGGAYASMMHCYDPVRKLQSLEYYDMQETFDRASANHVSGFPMIRTDSVLEGGEKGLTTEDPSSDGTTEGDTPPPKSDNANAQLPPNKQFESSIYCEYSTNHDFDNSDDIGNDEVFRGSKGSDGKLERRAMLELLQQQIIKVTIPIRSDLQVGQVIQLLIPEPEIMDEGSDTKDRVNDNRYLLTDLCIVGDVLSATGLCHLELVKESYAREISLDDIKAMNVSSSSTDNIGT